MTEKELLLAQLEALGVSPESGRKIRSDANKQRGPNSKIRSDAGTQRYSTHGMQKEPLAVYSNVRGRLLSRSAESDFQIMPDTNYIFMPMKRENKTINQNHFIVHRGKRIFRTVKHIKGNNIDLEKYRFNAIYSKILYGAIQQHHKPLFKNELDLYPSETWLELFCQLYHIKENEALKWSYDNWRSHYIIVCDDYLSPEFKLNIKHKPGSPEFLPEYADKVNELKQTKMLEVVSSKMYINERARVRDLIYTKAEEAIKAEIMAQPNSEQYTMLQLDKMVRQQVDYKELDRKVDEQMQEWLENKILSDSGD